jgi:hypothetical protein
VGDSNDTNPKIVMKEPGSAERGYRDSRRSLVEEGGAPKGVSSLSHFARQHVEPWRADWGEGGVTRRGGDVASGRTYSGASDGFCEVRWWWCGGGAVGGVVVSDMVWEWSQAAGRSGRRHVAAAK